jgi:PPIC-type PPIASE domain
MRFTSALLVLVLSSSIIRAQKMNIAEMKAGIEKADNSPLYVKDFLKKKFKIDTIVVSHTTRFQSMADSLAYKGAVKKVYGPFSAQKSSGKFLVQILGKAPNTFFRVSQIFLDTSVFRKKFADSLADVIITKIKNGTATFEQMAQTYSGGGEGATKGDMGWVAQGMLMPTIEHELLTRKKGEVFKLWSRNGLHILKKTDDPKKDVGFALVMRVFL